MGRQSATWSVGMRWPRAAGVALALAALIAACSDENAAVTGKPGTDVAADSGDGQSGLDVQASDAATDADVIPDATDDGSADAPDAADAADIQIEWPPLVPCSKNEECPSGFCLPTPDGNKCAQTCVDSCPPDFSCVDVLLSADVVYICRHDAPFRCSPCATDKDCASDPKAPAGTCVDIGDGGFCLQGCGAGAPGKAPSCVGSGFTCETVGSAAVCVPPGGKCPCPTGGKGLCKVVNAHGSCPGTFTCSDGAAGACQGTAAAPEVCDGKDQDCDGDIDEAVPSLPCDITNIYGTCLGKTLCVGSKTLCQGSAPAAEVCNGIDDNCSGATDEGFNDLDGDHFGDACDPDIDGDGIANAKDNCPGKANPDQADKNTNNIGDLCEDDWDSDGVANAKDNCPWVINQSQADADVDTLGDACDCDMDGDGAPNGGPGCPATTTPDNCPLAANASQTDVDYDGKGDACDPDIDGDGDPNDADCAPYDASISSKVAEACNGKDDDCDGKTDETGAKGCKDQYFDGDNDGFGVSQLACLCAPAAPYTATQAGDCNDKDAAVHPDAVEVCGNGKDDNCNGSDNDQNAKGCVDLYYDGDGDGYGVALTKCLCGATGFYSATKAGDCNDNDVTSNPGLSEKCGDSKDNDCDGDLDEAGCVGCVNYYQDEDGDGFGLAVPACLSAPSGTYKATKSGDCDDKEKAISPAATETCNGVDDDCDGDADEVNATGCATYFADADKDSYGVGVGSCLCKAAGALTASKDGDCDDKDEAVHPAALEVCGNGKDDNCQGGEGDKDAKGCTVYYQDADGDGAGTSVQQCQCSPSGTFTAKQAGDCDDKDPAMSANLQEKCKDNKDNNCDGKVDEAGCVGCQVYFEDKDGDGFGVESASQCLGAAAYPFTAFVGGDCDDKSANVKPGVAEVCNGADDNCDGQTDPVGAVGCVNHYPDVDQDSYGANVSAVCTCKATGELTSTKSGDCNDGAAGVNPGKVEVCNDVDDNCNGQVDEGTKLTFYKDNDGDGIGSVTSAQACKAPTGYVAESGDCNDYNKLIFPGAKEACNDIDDDCDGVLDNGVATVELWTDIDGDGFGSKNAKVIKKCLYEGDKPPAAYATNNGDCDDSKSTVYPGAPELCDGILNDCAQSVQDAHCPAKCEGNWPVFLGGSSGFPAIAQLDGDNNLEVITRNEGKARAIKHDGKLLWEQTVSISYSYPTLAPMNGDSTADLVLCEHGGGLKILDGGTGNVLAQHSVGGYGGWYTTTVFDVDRDGAMDVIGSGGAPYRLVLLNADLSIKNVVTLPTVHGEPMQIAQAGLFDLYGDGVPEVFFASGSWGCASNTVNCKGVNYLYGIDGTLLNDPTWQDKGKPHFAVAGWPKTYGGEGQWPRLADFDGDGVVEIYQPISGSSSTLWKVDGSDHPKTGKGYGSDSVLAPLDASTGKLTADGGLVNIGGAAIDIDGDGTYERVSYGGGGVSVYKSGKIMNGYPIKLSGGPIVTGDINRDGKLDILFIAGSNNSLNCYTLGEGTYSDERMLQPGTVWGLGRGFVPTLGHDPFEPNDIRSAPFAASKSGNPVHDSRAFRISALRDVFSSGGGWTHKLQALVGDKGDVDHYVLYGGIINVTLAPSVVDLDLAVHVYNASGGYLETRTSDGAGDAQESVTCHGTNNCPAGAHMFIIEVRGKDAKKDFGPWPYWLTTNWAQ